MLHHTVHVVDSLESEVKMLFHIGYATRFLMLVCAVGLGALSLSAATAQSSDAATLTRDQVIDLLVSNRWHLTGDVLNGNGHTRKYGLRVRKTTSGLEAYGSKAAMYTSITVGGDGTVTIMHDLSPASCSRNRQYKWVLKPDDKGGFTGEAEGENHECDKLYYYAARIVPRPGKSVVKKLGILVTTDRNVNVLPGKKRKNYWADGNQRMGEIELAFDLPNPQGKTPSEATLIVRIPNGKYAGTKTGLGVYQGHTKVGEVGRVKRKRWLEIPLQFGKIAWGPKLTFTLKALGKNAFAIRPKKSGYGARLLIKY